MGDGQVAELFEPLVGSTPGSIVEASTTSRMGNPVHIASPVQLPQVSGVWMPVPGMPCGVRSRLPDPMELYVLPNSVAASGAFANGWAIAACEAAPVTARVWTTTTTTITSTAAISAAQAELGTRRIPVTEHHCLERSWLARCMERQVISIP